MTWMSCDASCSLWLCASSSSKKSKKQKIKIKSRKINKRKENQNIMLESKYIMISKVFGILLEILLGD